MVAAPGSIRTFRRRPTVAVEAAPGQGRGEPHGDLDRLTTAIVGRGAASAVHALIGDGDEVWIESLAASSGGEPEAGLDGGSLFDLASLTKPWMATLALELARDETVPLDLRLGEIWGRAADDLAALPLRDLLRHRGGFQAWAPLYHLCEQRSQTPGLLLSGRLRQGRGSTYSDLDYILWGESVEKVTGRPLQRSLEQRLLKPLDLRLVTEAAARGRAVPCFLDGSREEELGREQGLRVRPPAQPRRGEPHDGNARFLGGLAGHAGLFSSAGAMWSLGRVWLRPEVLLGREAISGALAGSRGFALGWWRRRTRGGSGPDLSKGSFGHTGFTGGSLWIDPGLGRIGVLLAHRRRAEIDMTPWRRRFHRLLAGL